MVKYFVSLNALFLDKVKQDAIEGCGWLNVWNLFREEVIKAGQKMARSRWELLEGLDNHGGGVLQKEAYYTYKDGATGMFNFFSACSLKAKIFLECFLLLTVPWFK